MAISQIMNTFSNSILEIAKKCLNLFKPKNKSKSMIENENTQQVMSEESESGKAIASEEEIILSDFEAGLRAKTSGEIYVNNAEFYKHEKVQDLISKLKELFTTQTT